MAVRIKVKLSLSQAVEVHKSCETSRLPHFHETIGSQVAVRLKVKLSLSQDVKAQRVVRRRGSHIFSIQSVHAWR
jgi:hypothetical protein